MTLERWNHVAVMFDAASKAMSIAINGKVSQAPALFQGSSFHRSAETGFSLGGLPNDLTSAFRGGLDEVRIWSGVRYPHDFHPDPRFVEQNLFCHALFHFDEPRGTGAFANSRLIRSLIGHNGAATAFFHPLEMFRCGATGSGFSVSVPTEPGLAYTLEASSAMGDAPWDVLQEVVAEESVTTFVDPDITRSRRFYRVSRISEP